MVLQQKQPPNKKEQAPIRLLCFEYLLGQFEEDPRENVDGIP
jgi:hypothetical protein